VLLPHGNGSAIAFSDAGEWIIGIINQQLLGQVLPPLIIQYDRGFKDTLSVRLELCVFCHSRELFYVNRN
jgi:hypothetical protein